MDEIKNMGAALKESMSSKWANHAFNELQQLEDHEQVEAIQQLINNLHAHRLENLEKRNSEREHAQGLLDQVGLLMPVKVKDFIEEQ
jgi:hypothetical protein